MCLNLPNMKKTSEVSKLICSFLRSISLENIKLLLKLKLQKLQKKLQKFHEVFRKIETS